MKSVRSPRPTVFRARLPLLLSLGALLLLAVLAARGGSAVPHGNGLIVRGRDAQPAPQAPVVSPGQGHPNTVLTVGLISVVAIVLLTYLVGAIVIVMVLAQVRLRQRRRAIHRGGQEDEESEGGYGASAVVLL
ncbi:MAG TPA: hypothetical protein VF892_17120, partial [Pseudonocardiaceae bacterium]